MFSINIEVAILDMIWYIMFVDGKTIADNYSKFMMLLFCGSLINLFDSSMTFFWFGSVKFTYLFRESVLNQ